MEEIGNFYYANNFNAGMKPLDSDTNKVTGQVIMGEGRKELR